MNDKEYTYNIDKYMIGVDTNGEDGIGMTVAKVENGEIYFLGNCYGENARCIDLLLKENQELKKQVEEYKEQVHKGLYSVCLPYQTGYNKAIEDKEIKQKEFMKWLESVKFIGIIPIEIVCDKYKEIIGDDK